MNNLNVQHLGRKCAGLAAVAAAGFLSDWSADGLTGGIVLAISLGAGCGALVFREERADCLRHLRPRRSAPRDQ
jgi:hypothetical protein